MLNFLIAPDFPPENFSGWHMFNTLLQRRTNSRIRLLLPVDNAEESIMLIKNQVDLIYANPFDAAELIRKRGYLPVVKPIGQHDEMIIATYASSPYHHSDELCENCSILATNNHDVRLIGLRLLESATLSEKSVRWLDVATFQAAARRLINLEADAAFFLASAYHTFSSNTKQKMRVLMESRLNELSHVLLLHPKRADWYDTLLASCTSMKDEDDRAGQLVLHDLGIPQGFVKLEQEEAEFMIDLIETLRD